MNGRHNVQQAQEAGHTLHYVQHRVVPREAARYIAQQILYQRNGGNSANSLRNVLC